MKKTKSTIFESLFNMNFDWQVEWDNGNKCSNSCQRYIEIYEINHMYIISKYKMNLLYQTWSKFYIWAQHLVFTIWANILYFDLRFESTFLLMSSAGPKFQLSTWLLYKLSFTPKFVYICLVVYYNIYVSII